MAKRKSRSDVSIEGAQSEPTNGESVDGLVGVTLAGTGQGEKSDQASSDNLRGQFGRESITIRLTDSGQIDIAGMREKTTAKLRAALEATPEIAPGYGEIKLDGAMVPDFMVNAVYQLIGGIEQWVFARKYGPEIAGIMAYSGQDIAILADPTKAVLAKYLPKLGKYQEETALVMALASIHMGKIRAMNAMLERRESRPDVTEIKTASQSPN
jgi:hypothetical protein